MTDLPPPPPMTSTEIVRIIRDQWVENLGTDPITAELRGEQGFAWLLANDSIREWGFSPTGDTLYEPCTPMSPAVTVVIYKGYR
jgi:hypothetical protein